MMASQLTLLGRWLVLPCILCMMAQANAKPLDSSGAYPPTTKPEEINTEVATYALPASQLCPLTGHTYTDVSLSMAFVCKTKRRYQKKYNRRQVTFPGPNSVPHLFAKKETWQTKLGHIAGIVKNIITQGYLANNSDYERIFNPEPFNTFPYSLDEIANRTATLQLILRHLVSASGVEVETFPDEAEQAGDDYDDYDEQWPLPKEETGSDEEYGDMLSEYVYGSLVSTCLTLQDLERTLQLALIDNCSRIGVPGTSAGTASPVDIAS